MDYEKLVKRTESQSVNIAKNTVNSLRCNSDISTSLRIYQNGKIGVAGKIGKADEDALLEAAKGKLAQGIPYPCSLAGGKQETDDIKNIIAEGNFVKIASKLITRLDKAFPGFIFFNKINYEKSKTVYTNSAGADYSYSGDCIEFNLAIKDRKLSNITDLFYSARDNYYDEEKVFSDIEHLLTAFSNELPMPEGLPVILEGNSVLYFINDIIAESYMSGAGLFNGKLNEKMFSGDFTLLTDRSPGNRKAIPFFDDEGVINPDYLFKFFDKGIFCGLLATKRSASMFNVPSSGGAFATKPELIPSYGIMGHKVMPTADNISAITDKAVYVSISSGADITPDGALGMPVQLAFLYEGGKLLGRLPEFTLSGSIFDVLGKGYLGASDNGAFTYGTNNYIVCKMDFNK